MANVVILEYGYRMIGKVIYNSKMEPVSEAEYNATIKTKKSKANEWENIEPIELKEIIDGTEGSYIRDNSIIIGIDHECPFVVKLKDEFDGKTTICFKTIDLEELSYWLWKLDATRDEKIDFIVNVFDIDMELCKVFEGFKICEFIFYDYIYRLVIGIDSDYIKIKKVSRAPKISTEKGENSSKNIFDELGI